MEKGNKYGQMEACMRVIGIYQKRMDRENSFMLTEIFMKDNGKTIKLMAKAHIFILMGHNILENGRMINNVDMVQNHGQVNNMFY